MLDMAAPKYVPVKEGLLLLSIFLIILIIVLSYKRMKGPKKITDWNSIISIILATVLIFTSIALATYEEPRYYFRQTFELQIELVNSSDGYSMDEFWIETDNNLASIHNYENMNLTGINGLTPGRFETIKITKNDSAIFDGNDTLRLKFIFRYERFVLYYQNPSGNYTFFESSSNNNYEEPVRLRFQNDQGWIEFNIWLYEGPV